MMEEKMIQITSGKGPEECERVVFMLFDMIKKQAEKQQLKIEPVELVKGKFDKTYLSVLFKLKGTTATKFCSEWEGTIQWTGQSPFRKFHKRKNWFVGVISHSAPKEIYWNEKDIVYQTLRASGPGGQHINKVESAVRATHTLTGISVTASEERSQVMNKKAAGERLKNKLLSLKMEEVLRKTQEQWMEHNLLERGNPVMTVKSNLE
jgi:peptide chain release factor